MDSAISETTSFDAMLKALQRLKRIRKLEGTIVMKDGECLSSETLLGERELVDFVVQIKALLAQYRNSGSPLNRALLNFSGGSFLIFNLAPYVFCLFFGDPDEASVIEKAGEDFLEEWKGSLKIEGEGDVSLPELKIKVEPSAAIDDREALVPASLNTREPHPEGSRPISFDALDPLNRDRHFKEKVESLFAKVLSPSQVSQLLAPEWKAIKAIPYDSRKEPPEKNFGKSLISRIRDRRIRKQLSTALDDLVQFTYGQKRGGRGA